MLSHLRATPLVGLILASGWAASAAQAQSDRVFPIDGRTLSGNITQISAEGITIDAGGREVQVPATNIKMVNFADEPRDVTSARRAMSEERWNNALQLLETVDARQLAPQALVDDVEFLTALCVLKMAITGERGTLDQASQMMSQFVSEHPDSYQTLHAVEALGDVLLARGALDQAETSYQRLIEMPWPEVQQRGRWLTAKVQELQGDYEQALRNYEAVQQVESSTAESRQAKLLAQVGEARCRAHLGDPETGIQVLQQMIVEQSSSNVTLFAEIYNALGSCYEQTNQAKQAINAYLHTDLLFYQDAEAHAEALFHLGNLFAAIDKFDEAAQAREKLKTRYPSSPWARK